MDTSRHKFTNSNSWEPYNMSMENHIIHQNPFDHHHTQWSNHPLIIQEPSNNSSSTLLLAPSNLIGIEERENFKREADEEEEQEDAEEELGAMKEMMFKIAAMQPVDIDPATIRKPKRRNVRISDDPQSVAARHRRERISEKIRILQRLVPGGTKMDTASMLDEAIRYVKFLKRQIRLLQANHHHHHQHQPPCVGLTTTTSTDVDWVALTTSAAISGTPSYNLFEGNNNSDGAGHDDQYSMRHNLKFIGQ